MGPYLAVCTKAGDVDHFFVRIQVRELTFIDLVVVILKSKEIPFQLMCNTCNSLGVSTVGPDGIIA